MIVKKFFTEIWFSFPVQLLVNHAKRNHILLLCWVFLFLIVFNNFGRYLGIPYLFLDPEYLNKVGFASFFLIGIVLGGFTIAFHITTYILDGPRFSFCAALQKPFLRFSLNNSVIPGVFIILYVIKVIQFQSLNEFATLRDILNYAGGLVSGFLLIGVLLYSYFRLTMKDVLKYLTFSFDQKLKRSFKATRAKIMERINIAREQSIRVDYYLDLNLKLKTVPKKQAIDKETITKVFDQNHLNLIILELFIFVLFILMSIFRDSAAFQLPAAASVILFLTLIFVLIGAFSYWFRSWAWSIAIAIFVIVNFLVTNDNLSSTYKAFGIDYTLEPKEFSVETIKDDFNSSDLEADIKYTTQILEKWRSKFDSTKNPPIVFISVSGGGQRASLWSLSAIQKADSATNGNLMNHAILITGASGGIIGASYYRELLLRKKKGENINLNNPTYLENISKDNLNPLIFSFLVNDLLVKFQRFDYAGMSYPKDRGYSFEQQLNANTGGILDKPLIDYREHEFKNEIPMMIMAPTIINDGRKLFISPHSVRFMNPEAFDEDAGIPRGIDFNSFYEDYNSNGLRYLSALRMNASFPYITPNISLPSEPAMEIMDAGVADNFGIDDSFRFLFAFREWISANTSEVIILSIRDSNRNREVDSRGNKSLIQRFSNPISSVYINMGNLQEMNNNSKLEYSKFWLDVPVKRIELQYGPQSSNNKDDVGRASLNWRLTTREKKSIINTIYSEDNTESLNQLKGILLQ